MVTISALNISAALAALFIFLPVADSIASPFPAIAPAEQAARDNDRKQILTDELNQETIRHKEAQAAFSAAVAAKNRPAREVSELDEQVRRHSANIAALNREIANIGGIKQTRPASVAAQTKPATPVRVVAIQKDAEEAPVRMAEQNSVPWWDVYKRQSK